VIFVSKGATYDRFASRLSVMAAALAGGTLTIMVAAGIGGAPLRFAGLAGLVLLITVLATKMLTRRVMNWMLARGHLTRLVAVAADDPAKRAALVRLLRQRDDIDLVFIGAPAQFDLLGKLTQANQLDEIVLSGHQAREEDIAALDLAVTLVRVTPQDRLGTEALDPVWAKKQVFGPWSAPASIITLPPLRGWRGVTKRAIDIAVSIAALVLLSPVLLACAIAVKLESKGPVLFMQERAGYRSKPFRMLKFRSMCATDSDPIGTKLTARNDFRVTRVGAFLRRTDADELPQIFNVLKGEMSLVGPRPHPKGARAGTVLYDELIPNSYSRYRMKPGITGLAQIKGLRGTTETERHLIDRFGTDLQYAAE